MAPRWPKMSPRWPKMNPGCLQDDPERDQEEKVQSAWAVDVAIWPSFDDLPRKLIFFDPVWEPKTAPRKLPEGPSGNRRGPNARFTRLNINLYELGNGKRDESRVERYLMFEQFKQAE